MAKSVSAAEWQAARAQLLEEEEAFIAQLDAVNEKRQQMPMVEIKDPTRFKFDGPKGTQQSLLDLFDGRRQLITYNFMLYDDVEHPCVWCSFNMDNIPIHLGHLHSRDTSFVVMAPASVDKIESCLMRMGWTFPFYSSTNTIANAGAEGEEMTWKTGKEWVGYMVFFRDGDQVFHTYSATDRIPEPVMATIGLLDMTKLGRQENGEDRPFPLHDQYED